MSKCQFEKKKKLWCDQFFVLELRNIFSEDGQMCIAYHFQSIGFQEKNNNKNTWTGKPHKQHQMHLTVFLEPLAFGVINKAHLYLCNICFSDVKSIFTIKKVITMYGARWCAKAFGFNEPAVAEAAAKHYRFYPFVTITLFGYLPKHI